MKLFKQANFEKPAQTIKLSKYSIKNENPFLILSTIELFPQNFLANNS